MLFMNAILGFEAYSSPMSTGRESSNRFVSFSALGGMRRERGLARLKRLERKRVGEIPLLYASRGTWHCVVSSSRKLDNLFSCIHRPPLKNPPGIIHNTYGHDHCERNSFSFSTRLLITWQAQRELPLVCRCSYFSYKAPLRF